MGLASQQAAGNYQVKVFLSIFLEDILEVKCTALEYNCCLGNFGGVVQSSHFLIN